MVALYCRLPRNHEKNHMDHCGVGYWWLPCPLIREKKAKHEAERAEAKRMEQTIRSSVAEMVSRTNAVDGWDRLLSKGERFRFAPILTVELEKLWLASRPILFIGAIKDIATHNEWLQ